MINHDLQCLTVHVTHISFLAIFFYCLIYISGDITEAEMVRVLQTQFAPLAEALCKAVFDLSQRGDPATLDSLTLELLRAYPGMEKPASDIIYK